MCIVSQCIVIYHIVTRVVMCIVYTAPQSRPSCSPSFKTKEQFKRIGSFMDTSSLQRTILSDVKQIQPSTTDSRALSFDVRKSLHAVTY